MRASRDGIPPSWPLEIEAYGVAVGIDVRAPELRAAVEELLPPGWALRGDRELAARFVVERVDAGAYTISQDGRTVFGPAEGETAVRMLDSKIRTEIAGGVTDVTFVHAGVVAVADRAIVLPGRSYAGKTTLVAALIRAGAAYLSDEYAVLDDNGLVHPYPRLLSMREPGAERGRRPAPTRELSAASLGGLTADSALPIALVAILSYRAGATWDPQPRTRAEGALVMLSHAGTAQTSPSVVLRHVRAATHGAHIIEGERGEADEAAARLLEMCVSLSAAA